MAFSDEKRNYYASLCQGFRRDIIEMLYPIQTGHPGGSLSCIEILTALFYEKMTLDPQNPKMPDRDRFILGKGHAAPTLYLMLASKGYFPKEDLKTLRQLNSHLQGHPCAKTTPGVELSTGPLGLGISAGVGMALSYKLANRDKYIYVLLGDGEIQEGIVWEAAMAGAKFKTDNLIAILDNNGVQLDGTNDEVMPLGDIGAKWEAFGWNVVKCDGHDVESVCDAIDEAKSVKGKPTLILAKTVKGKGVSYMEGNCAYHGKPLSKEEYETALSELGGVN